MSTNLKAHELEELNDVDLASKLKEAKEELFNLRFQAATGQLESHGRLRTVKKDIARIYTVLRERSSAFVRLRARATRTVPHEREHGNHRAQLAQDP
jgi:ribosomal protein L29